MDGKRYLQQGFDVLAGGLKNAGWKQVTANDSPDEKNRTFSHSPFMYSHGERGGPLATYLVTANNRTNFKLWTNTIVKRVLRDGGHITGVEVEAFRDGGYAGMVNITSISGRVILSAGTFGSPKILFRSGIGPADQLAVVQSSESDADTMISNSSWINLPVGYNLVDHVNVSPRDSRSKGSAYQVTDRHRRYPPRRRLLRLLRGLDQRQCYRQGCLSR